DVPASQKLQGAAGHSHRTHPCSFCYITLDEINSKEGYDALNFVPKDDFIQLGNAERSRQILDETGVCYSCLNEVPGWRPVNGAILDYMHNFYGELILHTRTYLIKNSSFHSGIVNDFLKKILVGGYLLNKDKWSQFEAIINDMTWPSGTSRLPTNLGQNHSLNKADQLRQWVRIQPMVLWLCWRNETGRIPHVEPPIPANGHMPNFRRHLDDVYKQALYLSISDHILAAWSITQEEVAEGMKYLTLYNRGALAMRWPMVINNHLSMHYPDSFLRGPTNSWWLMGFERCNGDQKKVNLNGHAEGA
ncbi:hypothetical protein PILCRDRAFT_25959, partial [Piloderma croceum F 1598]